MPTYVAFLRAVNLGRNRKVPMAELRTWLTDAGYAEVETYIQTGNIKLATPTSSRPQVEADLEQLLAEHAGFEVVTIAFTPAELTETYAETERLGVGRARRYLTLLKNEPDSETAALLDSWDAPGEGAKVVGRAVCWWLDHPNNAGRLSNAQVEKRLGPGTTRDLKVVKTLVERWGTPR